RARSAGTGSPASGGRAAGMASPRTSMPDKKPAPGRKAASKKPASGSTSSARGRAQARTAATASRRSAVKGEGEGGGVIRGGLGGVVPPRPTPSRYPQDVQAVYRRRVPAVGVGPVLPGDRRGRHAAGPRRPGVAQGRQGRGEGRAVRVRALVRRDRLQPRPGPLPGGRDAGGPGRAVRQRGRRG